MATMKKVETEEARTLRLRVTLTATNVKSVEKVCGKLIDIVKKMGLNVKGPTRAPTKTLRITSRKAPNGEGTNTWDRWEMRIHKRWIDIDSPQSAITQITKIDIEPGVDIEVTVSE
eukprot:GHVL01034346.1.p1 GENE.GHVL01034346.1~~GHVL01034346.1.p1  ORF type:complete len:116 (-),score=12.37 GHVL01034346.1:524-871(-)